MGVVNKSLRVGYHVSIAGGMEKAFEQAAALGCTTMQIFISNPRSWSMGKVSAEEKRRFAQKGSVYDIMPVFAHMAYLPNIASPLGSVYERSARYLVENLKMCEALGIPYLVTHLGSSKGWERSAAVKRVSSAVRHASESSNRVTLLLENAAGQANSIGALYEEIADIRDTAGSDNIGFCIDTCHMFAAGYDIGDVKTLRALDRLLGIGNIKLIHFNDAKFDLGSRKDRHESIGAGLIGGERFKRFFRFRGIANVPAVLETPHSPSWGRKELEIAKRLISGV